MEKLPPLETHSRAGSCEKTTSKSQVLPSVGCKTRSHLSQQLSPAARRCSSCFAPDLSARMVSASRFASVTPSPAPKCSAATSYPRDVARRLPEGATCPP